MNVVIAGYGTVGKALHTLLKQHQDFDVCHIFVRKEKEDLPFFSNNLDILNDADIVFECLNGIDPADEIIRRSLKMGKHVISSNKMVIANNLNDYIKLQNEFGSTLQIEACVAGGIPFLDELLKLRKIAQLDGFEGIFNGTCNYILDSIFSKNMSFADSLANAQKLGYAEKDPKNDVEGFDVMYKTIIANSLAYGCDVASIPLVRGINTITDQDIQFAKEHHMVIRHLAISVKDRTGYDSWILPAYVREGSFFASIHNNYNGQIIRHASDDYIHLAGQGAGGLPTASAMLANAIDAFNHSIRPINLTAHLEPEPIIQQDILVRSNNNYTIIRNADRKTIQKIFNEDNKAQVALWREYE